MVSLYINIFFLVLLLLHFAVSSDSNIPPRKTLNIAGIFPLFNASFGRNTEGIQSLSAFIIAIREINNRTDILPNHTLKFTVRTPFDFTDTVKTIVDIQNDAFNGSGTEAFISGLPYATTAALNNVLNDRFQKLYITSVTGAVALSHKEVGMYKVRTVASDSYNGMALQDVIATQFRYKKLSIFYSYDETSLRTSMETGDGVFGEIVQLSSHAFQINTQDFTDHINAAKEVGSQIFIICADVQTGATLLEQGYNQGLFREGTQIFGSALLTEGQPWKYMSKDADVPAIMKGYIGLMFDPSFHLQDSQEGKDFVSKFLSQNATVKVNSDGTETCDESKDDDGHYLYREQIHSGPGRVRCAGMDFSTLKADGSDIAPHVSHAYDAVYIVAYGLHNLLEVQGQTDIDGGRLRQIIVDNVTFTGTTGLVDIYEGMPFLDDYGVGDRESGHAYRLYNFNEEVYRQTSGDKGYVDIGHWTPEDSVQLCDVTVDSSNCSPVTYRTIDNQRARDSPDDIIILMPEAMSVALYVIGAMIAILVVAVTIGTWKYKHTKIIKVSQPAMLFVILAGAMVGAGRVIAGGIPLSDGACMAEIWFIHMSFVLVCGSLFVKSWRVNALINSSKIRRIKITTNNVLSKVAIAAAVMVVYLMFITVFGGIRVVLTSTLAHNQITIRSHCTYKHAEMEMALYAIEGVVLGLGARLCWDLKSLPSSFNESKHIASAITCLVSITALVIPLAYLLNLEPHISRFIIAMAYGVWITFTVVIMFGDKLYRSCFGLGDKEDSGNAAESFDNASNGNGNGRTSQSNALFNRKSLASKVSMSCDEGGDGYGNGNGYGSQGDSKSRSNSKVVPLVPLVRMQSVGFLARQFSVGGGINKISTDSNKVTSTNVVNSSQQNNPIKNLSLTTKYSNENIAIQQNDNTPQMKFSEPAASKFSRQNSTKVKENIKCNITAVKTNDKLLIEFNENIILPMDINQRKEFIRKQMSLWEEAMTGIDEEFKA